MELQFRGEYVPLILDGRKTQTARMRRPACDEGDQLTLRNGYRPCSVIGRAEVASVTWRRLSQLTSRDARLDGFASAAEMREAVLRTYPGAKGVWLTRWRRLELEPSFQPSPGPRTRRQRTGG